MKDLGITRKIDELGRVVLPIEVRRALSLAEKDSVGFYLDENAQTVILKKSDPSCICCQATEDLRLLPHGKYICAACLKIAE